MAELDFLRPQTKEILLQNIHYIDEYDFIGFYNAIQNNTDNRLTGECTRVLYDLDLDPLLGLNASRTDIPAGFLFGVSIPDNFILPDNITSIGRAAFGYSDIKSISLPNTCKRILNYAFNNCVHLTDINFNQVQTIGDFSFYGCNGLKEIVIPDTCKSLGISCFQSCFNLEKVILPDNIIIEHQCFEKCFHLHSIYIGKNTKLNGPWIFPDSSKCTVYCPEEMYNDVLEYTQDYACKVKII